MGHFLGCFFHGVDDDSGNALDDVADAKADDGGIGIGCRKTVEASRDFGKEVAGFELEVILIDICHD